ncbi:50S ribosomal protein L5 [Patescibacteria group bacterium]|nr:50S ribosomal protein L5 [Patescibacteria group bacterium]
MKFASLHDRLRGPIAQDMKKELKIRNYYALPRIEKVVVNVGINKSKMDSKEMHAYIADCLMKITGQKPVFTKTRTAISNFKTREGMVVGAMVTLRGKKMEEFLDRLLHYALPRVRDFRGISANLDGHGNFAIGIRDHSIFPEVPLPDVKQLFGLQIQITTTTDSDDEARALLKSIGMPFKKEKEENKEKEEKKEKRDIPAPLDAAESQGTEVETEVGEGENEAASDSPQSS